MKDEKSGTNRNSNRNSGPYQVVELSRERRVVMNALDLAGPKHCMYGLLEVDVTEAKRFIDEHKARTGEALSFTGFLVYCLARAVDDDKAVQAYLKGRSQLVLFEDVNVGLIVERKIGGGRGLMGHVIRGADHKTYREIHQEIRAAQTSRVPPDRGMGSLIQRALLLPWPLSALCKALLAAASARDPLVFVSQAGTVGVTAVGMFGEGQGGWGLSPMMHSLALIVGSTAWKPAVVEGRIEAREILHLTVMFDHDVIDGGPAARFTRRLIELIESGYGLIEGQAAATQAARVPA
jgi:pyruvate/2-oxoglutarate dehydrogenase complex dihydrolipoamide acyltransferase (E2) component